MFQRLIDICCYFPFSQPLITLEPLTVEVTGPTLATLFSLLQRLADDASKKFTHRNALLAMAVFRVLKVRGSLLLFICSSHPPPLIIVSQLRR
jgi:hypothetical protein